MGRGLHTVEVMLGFQHGLDRSQHDWKIRGPTAGHDTVNGQLLNRGNTLGGRDFADFFLGSAARGAHHALDQLFGGRNNRQAIGPAPLKKEFDRRVIIGNINGFGTNLHV